jgi:hypothetical protein
MLNETNFGYSVGEIGVEAENAIEAHREINVFLDKYSWFF